MAVPGYQEFMLPLLKASSDGAEHGLAELMDRIGDDMKISLEDRQKLNSGSDQTTFYNRAAWALTYLAKSLLLERTGRGRFKIGPRGLEVLKKNPKRIDNAFLFQFPEFKEFKRRKNPDANSGRPGILAETPDESVATPDERLKAAYTELRETLADDLIGRLRACTPKFFEHVVVDLLVAMGYGGSWDDAAQVVGKSGDGGIDGVIKEDRLGLDNVYVQAKKWTNPVGPEEIDRFVGSLMRKKAHKGVFITTAVYTRGALQAAEQATAKIVLIDGDQLAELMIDHGVGVADQKSYVVKKVDGDYFEIL